MASLASVKIRANEIMRRIDTLTATLAARFEILPPSLMVEGLPMATPNRAELVEARRLERIADFLAQLEESSRPAPVRAKK